MTTPRDDWDADEREAFEGLEGELAEIRQRHEGDPSLALLRAADADALPPELQARVARHLHDSAWSRALLEGLREAGAGDRLDPESEDRLFRRITSEAQAAPASRRPRPRLAMALGGLALAATILLAVMVSRSRPESAAGPDVAPRSSGEKPAVAALVPGAQPAQSARVTFGKPEIKLSPSALTWRGDQSANPFLRDLAPAFDAYRSGDYARAVAAFDQQSTIYPDAIEVLFYQGVSRLLAGDDAGAVAPLEAAGHLRNPTFADDVAWYLAVARQRSGQPEARARFAALCQEKGTYSVAACAAVTQLDSLASPPPRP